MSLTSLDMAEVYRHIDFDLQTLLKLLKSWDSFYKVLRIAGLAKPYIVAHSA